MKLLILAISSLAVVALSSTAADSHPEYECWVNRPGQCASLCANGDDTENCGASFVRESILECVAFCGADNMNSALPITGQFSALAGAAAHEWACREPYSSALSGSLGGKVR